MSNSTGQFWNIPVSVEPYTAISGTSNLFNVTIFPVESSPRSFLGGMYDYSWDHSFETCLYSGSGQGGPGGEVPDLTGSVIEGIYKDYIVESLFETDYKFSHVEGSCRVG